MVKVSDCTCCDCDSAQEKEQIKERALSSINKVYTTDARTYYPDGTGMVTLPLPTSEQIASLDGIDALKATVATNTRDIATNAENIAGEQTEIDTLRSAMKTIDDNVDAVSAKVTANTASIATHSGDITALKGRMDTAETGIANANTKDTAQDQSISTLQALTNNITSHLISSVAVKDGTSNGSIMVELTEEGGAKITSPNYPWGQLNTFQLLQGSQAGYVRGKLILSDGTEIESNDFQILEVIESDVYVTSITLTPYPTTGKLGGTIGYSNGNTQTINAVDVPTAPGVTSNINELLTRMGAAESSITENASDIVELGTRVTAVETKNTTQDNQIVALQNKDSTIDGQIESLDSRVTAIEETPGVGAFTDSSRGTILGSTADGRIHAESDGTGSVNGWSSVKSSIEAHTTEITALNTLANRAYDDAEISGSTLTLTRGNGGTTQIEIPSGGNDEWEEIDMLNPPNDWEMLELIKIVFKVPITEGYSVSSWTDSTPSIETVTWMDYPGPTFTTPIGRISSGINITIYPGYPINIMTSGGGQIQITTLRSINPASTWNKSGESSLGMLSINRCALNAKSKLNSAISIGWSNIQNYVYALYRKKKS